MQKHPIHRLSLLILAGALCPPALFAVDPPAKSASSLPIAAVRAQGQLYSDVYSSDGKKVGDIVDFVVQFENLPQLRYVIVRTGGILPSGGEHRAVPADAISLVDGRYRVSLARDAYRQLPALPRDVRAHFHNAANVAEIAKQFSTPADHAAVARDCVLFSSLGSNGRIMSADHEELGRFADLWIDFNANQAPYLEFTPTNFALEEHGENTVFDLPTTQLVRAGGGEIVFALSAREVDQSKSITDASAHAAKAGEMLDAAQTAAGQ